ncbi:MAG: MMPL family transporter [Streptosporangiaceae bacterium]
MGVPLLSGLAVAAAIGVAFTMLAALTLLPALLGFIGPRILSRRQAHRAPAGAIGTESGFWYGWATFIQRQPGPRWRP